MTDSSLSIVHARSFGARLGGLLARPPLGADEALYLSPCSSVHSCFMQYAIDVAFLDRDARVMKIVTLAPWRAAGCLGARGALEMRAGASRRLGVRVGATINLGRPAA